MEVLKELSSLQKVRGARRLDIAFAVMPERGRNCVHLGSCIYLKQSKQVGSRQKWWGERRMVRAKASRTPSKCWIWKAVQSAPISAGAGNCERGARSVVLACTPEDSERQELYTITGIDRTQGGAVR